MDFNKELRSFRISHIFAVAGSLFFLINASFIVPENLNFPAIDLMSPLSIMAIILLLLAVFIAPFAAVKLISSLDKNSSLEEKFKRYRNATVLKWAIITAPIWFLIVCIMISPNWFYISAAFVLIILLIMNRPSKNRMAMMMRLDAEEIVALN